MKSVISSAQPVEPASIGQGVSIVGEVHASGGLTIEGAVHGPIWCEEGELLLTASAVVAGDIVARDVTIEGQMDGQIIATDVVDVRAGAHVTGRIISRRFILVPDATVHVRVEPQHLDTAIRVARFQQQKKNAAG
jgi:cytoskeletal protein CcmA (bactofilin family)